MIDYVLKFDSEQQSIMLAYQAGLISDGETESDRKLIRWTPQYGIFVQGTITQPAPLDANGKSIGEPVTLDGWWVRVRILDDALLPEGFENFVTDERPNGLWGIA
jgi:hypothetical protein